MNERLLTKMKEMLIPGMFEAIISHIILSMLEFIRRSGPDEIRSYSYKTPCFNYLQIARATKQEELQKLFDQILQLIKKQDGTNLFLPIFSGNDTSLVTNHDEVDSLYQIIGSKVLLLAKLDQIVKPNSDEPYIRYLCTEPSLPQLDDFLRHYKIDEKNLVIPKDDTLNKTLPIRTWMIGLAISKSLKNRNGIFQEFFDEGATLFQNEPDVTLNGAISAIVNESDLQISSKQAVRTSFLPWMRRQGAKMKRENFTLKKTKDKHGRLLVCINIDGVETIGLPTITQCRSPGFKSFPPNDQLPGDHIGNYWKGAHQKKLPELSLWSKLQFSAKKNQVKAGQEIPSQKKIFQNRVYALAEEFSNAHNVLVTYSILRNQIIGFLKAMRARYSQKTLNSILDEEKLKLSWEKRSGEFLLTIRYRDGHPWEALLTLKKRKPALQPYNRYTK